MFVLKGKKNGRFPTWEPTVCVMGLYILNIANQ
jgi:hypothetical protein